MKQLLLSLLVLFSPVNLTRTEFAMNDPTVVQIDSGCSGFIGFPSVVITAAHCVGEEASHTVTFSNGVQETFKVIAKGAADNTDWALLYGNTRGIEPVTYAPLGAAKPKTPCLVVGHGGGSPRQLGTYCFIETPDPAYPGYIELAATVIPGDSGSAARLEDGSVFAIVVRTAMPFPIGMAVPVELARRAYAAWMKKHK